MRDRQITTATGAVLKEAAVEAFRSNLRGKLLCSDDDEYDDARKVWNGMIDKKPALIARCAGVADVINSVNFARAHKLLVAVRGGGHNVAGNAVCSGGLMIDLSVMRSVRVDVAKRIARAEGGATWADFDHETAVFGLATTGGLISTTGIAGLTLGGGMGWLMRKHGLACDNLLSVDIVTANGQLLTASATSNADLFWGVHGGGGNFGIITSFEYQLHPVGPLLVGVFTHPQHQARELFRFYRDFTRSTPDALGSMARLTLRDGTPAVSIVVAYDGAIEEGKRVIQPLMNFGPSIPDFDSPRAQTGSLRSGTIGPMDYTDLQKMFDATPRFGKRYYLKSNFLKILNDDVIDALVCHAVNVPSPQTSILIEELGGAVSRVGVDETAFNHRDAHYNLLIQSVWLDAADDEINIQWTRKTWEAMQPFLESGVYVNYLGQENDEGIERIRAAYGSAKYEKLVNLKNKYDPTNLFRLNQNIRPTV